VADEVCLDDSLSDIMDLLFMRLNHLPVFSIEVQRSDYPEAWALELLAFHLVKCAVVNDESLVISFDDLFLLISVCHSEFIAFSINDFDHLFWIQEL
jgi:hypothetical protein